MIPRIPQQRPSDEVIEYVARQLEHWLWHESKLMQQLIDAGFLDPLVNDGQRLAQLTDLGTAVVDRASELDFERAAARVFASTPAWLHENMDGLTLANAVVMTLLIEALPGPC